MKIFYYADNASMGDTSTVDCEKYRNWAASEIEAAYPGHEVKVLNEPSTIQVWTNDYENEDEIKDFIHRLWDACPWDFLD